tara:strand:- start:41 stop:388 length:348 start_codon:yes stop_codon:yes gene_type:complete
MPRQKVVNGVYYDLTPEEEAELVARAEAADLDLSMVRAQRNALLGACDWTQLGDAALAGHTAAEWATYRQELRDLPSVFTRQSEVVWPRNPVEEAAWQVAEAARLAAEAERLATQ